ncbi:acetyltransferase [Polyangium mundeleinium]|uniref:Acetyltransferase n=1 Tax=Polyangium mundeleinium TaxID=2995306 RepID=A0ABT5F2H4_9BACT|nr:acetyltransferase [Polyangium mundeleinium]MDC0747295.1 acetyltransferase [Polyangium mundeleinium]
MSPRRCATLLALLGASAAGCVEPLTLESPPPEGELAPGESRAITLRFLRLDVEDFAQTLGPEELRRLPRKTLEETWLFDMELRPLVENALDRFTRLSEEEANALPQAAWNMFALLHMTPASARLEGTSLAGLTAVGEAVGISPLRILADLAGVGPNEPLAPRSIVTDVVLDQVIATHPRARVRKGPVTDDHPEGLYDVEKGKIALTLYDVATDFASLSERFGRAPLDPAHPEGPEHPGFLRSASGLSTADGGFRMTVRLDVNALPYRGVDASHARVASVNSIGGQIGRAFDFTDPRWLEVQGLAEDLAIREMTMTIDEDPAYLAPGTRRDPRPLGNSAVWNAAPWVEERVLAETGRRLAARIPPHCTTYSPAGEVSDPFEAVRVCIDGEGWVQIDIDPSVILDQPPPRPSYYWDMLLEVAQARMHDGGLAEGEANVVMAVHDVPVGVRTEQVVARIRENIEKNPATLREMAEALTQNTRGDADFFYVQPEGSAEDWLYFVAPEDIRKDTEGNPVRPYAYTRPGFFADPALTQKVSSRVEIDGDQAHEKVRIEPGERLYVEDAEGRVFEIVAEEKPSLHRLALVVTRAS